MAERLGYKEPAGKRAFAFDVVPAGKLDVIEHQRKASAPHVARVVDSIERVGFVAPLVVVERAGRYVIIDGQHRFLAAQELGLRNLPVVIVTLAVGGASSATRSIRAPRISSSTRSTIRTTRFSR